MQKAASHNARYSKQTQLSLSTTIYIHMVRISIPLFLSLWKHLSAALLQHHVSQHLEPSLWLSKSSCNLQCQYPYVHWFEFWQLHARPTPCKSTWKAVGNTWVPVTLIEQLWWSSRLLNSAMVDVTLWGVNQQLEDTLLSLPFSLIVTQYWRNKRGGFFYCHQPSWSPCSWSCGCEREILVTGQCSPLPLACHYPELTLCPPV